MVVLVVSVGSNAFSSDKCRFVDVFCNESFEISEGFLGDLSYGFISVESDMTGNNSKKGWLHLYEFSCQNYFGAESYLLIMTLCISDISCSSG